MKSILTSLAAMVLALAVGGAVQAGDHHDKDQDKKDHYKKDHDKDQDKGKDKDKGKKDDGTSKLKDQVVSLLKDQIDRDHAQVGLASQKLAMDILPATVGGHPERVAADQAQLAASIEKLNADKILLDKAMSDPKKK